MSGLRRLIVGALTLSTPALAQGWQDPASIDAAIADAGVTAPPTDARLRLAQCAAPLVVTNAADGIRVRCAAPAWSLRVPVSTASPTRETASPPLFARGDDVTLMIRESGFDVAVRGTAEGEGRIGQPVRVMVNRRSYQAIVDESGTAITR